MARRAVLSGRVRNATHLATPLRGRQTTARDRSVPLEVAVKDAEGAVVAVPSGGQISGDCCPPGRFCRSLSAGRLPLLTPREGQTLRLVGLAMSDREIAREMAISERTVRAHMSAVFVKLEVSSRLQAATVALLAWPGACHFRG